MYNKIMQGSSLSIDDNIIHLAGMTWKTITYESQSRLLLSQDVVSIRPYDCDFTYETWETSSLRRYLNTKFLNRFTPLEKKILIQKRLNNPRNPVFGTSGGKETDDLVFVLSLDELDMYMTPFMRSLFSLSNTFFSSNSDQYDKIVEMLKQLECFGFFCAFFGGVFRHIDKVASSPG